MSNNSSNIKIRINSREGITFDRVKLLDVLRKYNWTDIDEFIKYAKSQDYDYILQNYQECVVKFENVAVEQPVIK
ncbi:hypothetical protein [Bacillus bombysepticus]|uniref:hypothetical protein n=1 Tax=Bacillus bombysepticus TaxID=658666 RepID=UPI0030162A51